MQGMGTYWTDYGYGHMEQSRLMLLHQLRRNGAKTDRIFSLLRDCFQSHKHCYSRPLLSTNAVLKDPYAVRPEYLPRTDLGKATLKRTVIGYR
jgi:hypothetical protein